MKKITLLLCILLLTGCGFSKKEAENTITDFYEYAAESKGKKLANLIDFGILNKISKEKITKDDFIENYDSSSLEEEDIDIKKITELKSKDDVKEYFEDDAKDIWNIFEDLKNDSDKKMQLYYVRVSYGDETIEDAIIVTKDKDEYLIGYSYAYFFPRVMSSEGYQFYDNVAQENENIENIEVEDNNDDSSEEDTYSNIDKIDVKKLKDLILKKESFILILTGTTCPHCHEYKPVLNEVLKSKRIYAYELDVWALESSDIDYVNELFPDLDGVPTTTFFKNGGEQKNYRYSGNLPKDSIEENLKKAGY